jgi:hypothetical protein
MAPNEIAKYLAMTGEGAYMCIECASAEVVTVFVFCRTDGAISPFQDMGIYVYSYV